MNSLLMLILEVIGTVAFAVTGAFLSVKRHLDIFGVIFIGCITAVGGGITRDIIIGRFPPAIFSNTKILLIAAVTSVVVFLISYLHADKFERIMEKTERINNIFDAVGLSAFAVTGTEAVCSGQYGNYFVLAVLMGMLTGVGGGIFRDILVTETPVVLKKHVYALAAIIGSVVYYILRGFFGVTVASVVAMVLIFTIRMLATKYRWKLPKVKLPKTYHLHH